MTRRARRGRRPKRREERQSRVIAVRLTPAEFDELRRRAEGLPPATLVRGLTLRFLERGQRLDEHERRVEDLQRRHDEIHRRYRESEEGARRLFEDLRRLRETLSTRVVGGRRRKGRGTGRR